MDRFVFQVWVLVKWYVMGNLTVFPIPLQLR